jgi:hypothetical protein
MRSVLYSLLIVFLSSFVICQQQINVAMFVLNVDTIDLKNGIYNADFLLYMHDTDGIDARGIVSPFLNNIGRFSKIENLTRSYRIAATFSFFPTTASYPFDEQILEIVLEDTIASNFTLFFRPLLDISGISPQMRLQGWDWTNRIDFTTRDMLYPAEQRSSAQLVFQFKIKRPLAVAVKTFLPPAFMLVSVLGSFSLPIKEAITRLGIATSALVAEVLFHTNLLNTVPFTGETWLADYFMIICYAIITLSIIINIIGVVLKDSKSIKARDSLHYFESRAKYLVWLFFPWLFFFIFVEWFYAIIAVIMPSLLYFAIRELVRCVRLKRAQRKSASAKADGGDDGDAPEIVRGNGSDVTGVSQDMRNEVIKHEYSKPFQQHVHFDDFSTDSDRAETSSDSEDPRV